MRFGACCLARTSESGCNSRMSRASGVRSFAIYALVNITLPELTVHRVGHELCAWICALRQNWFPQRLPVEGLRPPHEGLSVTRSKPGCSQANMQKATTALSANSRKTTMHKEKATPTSIVSLSLPGSWDNFREYHLSVLSFPHSSFNSLFSSFFFPYEGNRSFWEPIIGSGDFWVSG